MTYSQMWEEQAEEQLAYGQEFALGGDDDQVDFAGGEDDFADFAEQEGADFGAAGDEVSFEDFAENEEGEVVLEDPDADYSDAKKAWYIVQTASSYEQAALDMLQSSIKDRGMEAYFKEFLIPIVKTETTVANKKGTRVVKKEKKLFPGYIFVLMNMNFNTMDLVKSSTHVLSFLSHAKGRQPEPVHPNQMKKIFQQMEELEATPAVKKSSLDIGQRVEVRTGPFVGQQGTVLAVNEDEKTVKIEILMFNRPTEVDLNLADVAPEQKL